MIQKTLWIIPVMQTIHILSVAMVFSSVVMIELRVLGLTRSQTIEDTARRFVPWIFGGVGVLALTGTVLIIGEPQRSLPSYEFQMKILYLAVAIAFNDLILAADNPIRCSLAVRARRTAAGWSGSNAVLSRPQIAPALAVESCCATMIEASPAKPPARRRSGGCPARANTGASRGSAAMSRLSAISRSDLV